MVSAVSWMVCVVTAQMTSVASSEVHVDNEASCIAGSTVPDDQTSLMQQQMSVSAATREELRGCGTPKCNEEFLYEHVGLDVRDTSYDGPIRLVGGEDRSSGIQSVMERETWQLRSNTESFDSENTNVKQKCIEVYETKHEDVYECTRHSTTGIINSMYSKSTWVVESCTCNQIATACQTSMCNADYLFMGQGGGTNLQALQESHILTDDTDISSMPSHGAEMIIYDDARRGTGITSMGNGCRERYFSTSLDNGRGKFVDCHRELGFPMFNAKLEAGEYQGMRIPLTLKPFSQASVNELLFAQYEEHQDDGPPSNPFNAWRTCRCQVLVRETEEAPVHDKDGRLVGFKELSSYIKPVPLATYLR